MWHMLKIDNLIIKCSYSHMICILIILTRQLNPISVVICWYWIKVHNLKMIFTVRRRCHGAKLRHPHSGFMGRYFTLQCHHHLMYPNQVDNILPQYWPSITKKRQTGSHDYHMTMIHIVTDVFEVCRKSDT